MIEPQLPGIKYCMLIASSLSLSPRRQMAAPENSIAATNDHPTPTHASIQLQSQLTLVLSRRTCTAIKYYKPGIMYWTLLVCSRFFSLRRHPDAQKNSMDASKVGTTLNQARKKLQSYDTVVLSRNTYSWIVFKRG